MKPEVLFMLLAAFGALCNEIVHWYELRNKLDEEETKKLFTSKYYWIITIITILISGVGTFIIFYEQAIQKMSIPFVLGAAFPLLFKKVVTAIQSRDLGAVDLTGPGKVTFEKAFKSFL